MNDKPIKIERHRRDIGEIVNSIRLLQGIGQQQSREFIRKYRITGQQLGALRIVALSPGIHLGDLSERMFLHISSVSGIIDRLEKRGYVTRERNNEDRRVVHLKVTTEGRQVIKRTPLAGMGLLVHTIDRLPAGQLHDILKGLKLILKVMKIDGRTQLQEMTTIQAKDDR
jgi:MarR family transcriptional regulator, organic hydroperoxide resistance regulator